MNPTFPEIEEVKMSSPVSSDVSRRNVINTIEQQRPVSTRNTSRSPRRPQKLPCADLLESREDYFNICVPLYEASSTGDWAAAKVILDTRRELARFAITQGYDTALHVAALAEETEMTEGFVENLLSLMTKEDLELENKSYNTAFYLAAAAGKIKMVRRMLNMNLNLQNIPGNTDILPLYMSVLLGKYETVKYLYEASNKMAGDVWKPKNRSWVLEKCVECDFFDVALKIVTDSPELAANSRVLRALARKPDVYNRVEQKLLTRIINSVLRILHVKEGFSEKDSEALKLLRIILKSTILTTPKSEVYDIHRGPSDPIDDPILHTSSYGHGQAFTIDELPSTNAIGQTPSIHDLAPSRSQHSFGQPLSPMEPWDPSIREIDQALSHEEHGSPTLSEMGSHKGLGSPPLTARSFHQTYYKPPSVIHGGRSSIWSMGHVYDQPPSIWSMRHVYAQPPSIGDVLSIGKTDRLDEWTSSKILFVAAEIGNTTFLIELLRLYPDLIQKKNDDNQTIFHIAVMHRHQGIYNLMYEIGAMKDMITPLKDKEGNNMLHLVGKTSVKMKLQTSGASLLMQRELLWFKEVEKMMPPFFRGRKNKKGQTPYELFSQENTHLVSQGLKWMKDCMVVATLIVTVAFAVAFTVPGGYNQEIGIPIFIHGRSFLVFVVADAICLFSSSTSLLVFLSILTSRHGERDFMYSLPRKLMIGLTTLFISVAAMMITFSASFFVLYHNRLKWVPILIATFAGMPVIVFAVLQFPLMVDMFRSMYDSRYLFKPKKRMLYNTNPRF